MVSSPNLSRKGKRAFPVAQPTERPCSPWYQSSPDLNQSSHQLQYRFGICINESDMNQWQALISQMPQKAVLVENARLGLKQASRLLRKRSLTFFATATDLNLLFPEGQEDGQTLSLRERYSDAVIQAAHNFSALGAYNHAVIFHEALERLNEQGVCSNYTVGLLLSLSQLNAAFFLAQYPKEHRVLADEQMAAVIKHGSWSLIGEAIYSLLAGSNEQMFNRIMQLPEPIHAGTAMAMALYYLNREDKYSLAIECAALAWGRAQTINPTMPPAAAADIAYNALAVIRQARELGGGVLVNLSSELEEALDAASASPQFG